MSRETLNEEQTKGAQKDSRKGFDWPVWAVESKTPILDKKGVELPKRGAFVEAERFIDARGFACRLFGVSEVTIVPHAFVGEKPFPRWQVRFTGNASNGNNIRMEVREVTSNTHNPEWRDIRKV